jgi:diguanylate cyclase (GGDEF)-like protein
MHRLKPSATTILLIAFQEVRRTQLAQQLETLGYSVLVLPSPRALNTHQHATRYDLIVIDQSGGNPADMRMLSEGIADFLGQGVPVLTLTNDEQANPDAWTQETLGYRVTAALRNRNASDVLSERMVRWEGLNVLDPETLLFRRRYFDAILATEIERAKRIHQPMTLVLIDLTFDDQGAGIWREISIRLLASLRQTDMVVRYGDHQVMILLPVTEAALARAVAARLVKAIESIPADPAIQTMVGLAAYPQHGTTVEALLSAAHHALHTAVGQTTRLSDTET